MGQVNFVRSVSENSSTVPLQMLLRRVQSRFNGLSASASARLYTPTCSDDDGGGTSKLLPLQEQAAVAWRGGSLAAAASSSPTAVEHVVPRAAAPADGGFSDNGNHESTLSQRAHSGSGADGRAFCISGRYCSPRYLVSSPFLGVPITCCLLAIEAYEYCQAEVNGLFFFFSLSFFFFSPMFSP